MASFPESVFEYTIGGREVYFTTNFFKIFLIGQEKRRVSSLDRFKEMMLLIAEYIDPALSPIRSNLPLTDSCGKYRLVRLKLIDSGGIC